MGDAGVVGPVPFASDSCLFPALNTKPTLCQEIAEEDVPIDSGQKYQIQRFCDLQGIELPRLFQVTWAIVLRTYTGSKSPSFRYVDGQKNGLLRLHLSEKHGTASLAKSFDFWEDTALGNAQHSVNSAMIWNTTNKRHSGQVPIILDAGNDGNAALRYRASALTKNQAIYVADLVAHVIVQLSHGIQWTELNLCPSRCLQWLSQRRSFRDRVDACVHELILDQCQARPDAPAVCAWDGELTYGELDHLSARLAEYLTRRGVGPEIFVALYFEKSQWAVVALLAVIRAGGAFVFLEPSLPSARLQDMCHQLNINLILTAAHLTRTAAEMATVVIPVGLQSEFFNEIPSTSPATLPAKVEPHNALYAIYTSGSTGTPKGVINIHSSYCTGQKAQADIYQVEPSSRVFQFASFAFDMSILDILITLVAGACLCIPSESSRRSNITDAIIHLRANYLLLTPTVSRLLSPTDLPLVKTLVHAGEALRESDISPWISNGVRTLNGYGPAECCISTSAHVMNDEEDPRVFGSVDSPFCWIVDPDDHHKLLPIGAVGELLIDGPIVGRGYVGDPVKTAASFVSSPAWRQAFPGADPAARMYKTGDLVQYVADGKIAFIGRKDAQVKLHGQRLELPEVEHHLRNVLGGNQDTVVEVITPADSDSNPILAAFVLSAKSSNDVGHDLFVPPSEDFRRVAQDALGRLHNSLPQYMVPSVMIPMTTMPTTHSGKLDRRHLRHLASQLTRRQLEAYTRETAVQKRSPASPMEIVLCGLVEKVLNVKQISMNDNFFSLGGDSVRAMQLAQAARREAGVDLAGMSVFTTPVLADLALTMVPSQGSVAEIPSFSLLGNQSKLEQTLLLACKECGLASTAEIEDIYPCTPLQEGMMALSIASMQAKYATQAVFRIPHAIDIERLKDAWNTVIEYSPVLRTRIIQDSDGQSLQIVVRGNDVWDHAGDLETYIEQNAQTGFRLGGPLLRLAIAEKDGFRYLAFTIHHVLYDGASLPEVYSQVDSAYYGDHRQSKPFNLFINYLLTLDQDEADAFWRDKLAGYTGPCFPNADMVNRQPTSIQTMERSIAINPPKSLGVTTATAFRLAWALTLSQYGGSDDVVFGETLAGRNVNVPGIEDILGPTMTTVPLRIRLPRMARVHDLLRAVQEASFATMPFEHVGLQRIASLGSDEALACAFQSLLIIQPPKDKPASTIFNCVEEKYSTEIVDNYPLMLEVHLKENDAVKIVASYDSDMIERSLMHGILGQLVHNIHQLTDSTAEMTMKDLRSINPAEFDTIKRWNDHVPPAIDCCVHDVIRRHGMARPESIAVTAWDGRMTYKQLDKHSANMAAHLTELGIGPGTFAMIHLGRCLWAVVAMMAVMKAGGAFVLLESGQPVTRMQQICQETRASLVITSSKFQSSQLGPQVVNIDSYDYSLPKHSPSAEVPVGPHDPAYVVFTSGSTGRPKGVVIQHRALLTSAVMNGARQYVNSDTRFLQCSSFTFDASMAEIIYTLVHGGCVCIPTEADSRNNIEKAISDYGVTHATLTPSVARTLDPSKVTSLRALLLGGEAMASTDIQMWAGRVQLVNGYGPAECCVDAIVQPNVTSASEPGNIGWGVAVASWIVDPRDPGILQPIGVVGELLLEGPTLAQGYLHNPNSTAASFIEYPDWRRSFQSGKPGRLYRTGDLVRYSPKGDGSLLYVGRQDNQVKLRGQRIELGEVEEHVRQALSTAREVVAEIVKPSDATAQSMLVAYVLADDAGFATRDESSLWISASDGLRAQIQDTEATLQARIPSYMIPAVFLPLARVPFTISGKIDRRLLREEASKLSRKRLRSYTSRIDLEGSSSPSTRQEAVLQDAIAGVLQLPPTEIGMQDHFFRLGGDSIAAMKLVGAVRGAGFNLTVADIFSHPCISDLARLVSEDGDQSPSPFESIPPFSLLDDTSSTAIIEAAAAQCGVDRDSIQDVYPCTPMQEGLLALSMLEREKYIGKFVFDIPKGTDVSRLQSSWQAVFDSNPILRTRVVQAPGDSVLYQAVLREQVAWSGDLSPLTVSQGRPLYKQAESAYNGNTLDFRPFSPFVAYTHSLGSAACSEFWESECRDINGAATFPALTTDSPAVISRESISSSVCLSDTCSKRFTLPCMLQLAIAVVLGHRAPSNDVIYGITLTGRSVPVKGIDKISGPTITTVPFRCKLNSDKKIEACLEEVQNHLVRMIPYEQMGLQNIRSINPETKVACDFRCHLIIQLDDESAPTGNSLFREQPSNDDLDSNFASYPLVLVCTVNSDRKTVRFTANFETCSVGCNEVDAILDQLGHVFQQIARNQDQSLADLEMITPSDWSRVADINATVPSSVDRLVHELVFDTCKAHPEDTAIDAWDGMLSYSELLAASLQFSRCLIEKGIGAHPVTAICMEKSRWTIVAILAVLQTGSAVTMIDPSIPVSRIQAMINQTATVFTVASPHTKGLLKDISTSVVVMAPFEPDASQPYSVQSIRGATSRDPAVIQFTSGSTGTPKGMVLEHTSIATALRNLTPVMKLHKSVRMLHFTSYAFDMGFFEPLACLTSGGCLCIPSDTDRTSDLEGFIQRYGVNWAFMTPSATRILNPSHVPTIKTLIVGGEPLTTSVANQWAGRLDLVNIYGPAECTVTVAAGQVPPTDWIPGTIGPTVNGVCWITSASNPHQLAAWGAVGELLVEGPIVARGYIGSPEKTASSFIPSPAWLTKFRGHDKSRLYRTGDLVQYTENAEIKFICRRDRQVKINGQRIELSEVENHLTPCFPAGTTVVVEKVTLQSTARSCLCAFICFREREKQMSGEHEIPVFARPDEGFWTISRAATAGLSKSLSRYMVPQIFIPLNRVPQTSSGKVNRSLLCDLARTADLSDLDGSTVHHEESHVPSTEIEKKLAGIWAELLGIELGKIGAGTNFFHIGGDSILAMKLAAESRRHGLNLTVPFIFSHPVLSEMASSLEKMSPSTISRAITRPFALLEANNKHSIVNAAAQQCSVLSDKVEDIYPCTPLQEGLMSLSMRAPGAFVGSFSYSLPVDIDITRFRKAWQVVAKANPIMRTRIVQHGALFQCVLNEELPWMAVSDITECNDFLLQREMHLGQPLMFLAHGREQPGNRTSFLLVMHHVLYDASSLQSILDQVHQAYNGHSLPVRTFNGFIEYLTHSNGKAAHDYWTNLLADFSGATFPSLPSADYQPVADSTISEMIPLQSPAGITKATVLQLAWSLILSRYTDVSDVVFGLNLSGRQASLPGIESVTGPTITTVPLRVCVQGEQSIMSELSRLQEQLATMVPFEQLGLQNIRRLGADAAAACDFQILMLIQPALAASGDEFLLPIDQRGSAEAFSAYALEITCETFANRTSIRFDFDPRVIHRQQAQRLLSCYTHILRQMQQDPNKKIFDIDYLDPSAHREIMQWNAKLPPAVDQFVHEGIHQQCIETPDAPAVCAWDGGYTYRELDHLSSILAEHVHNLGVGPEVFVPILSEKSCWVAVDILGVIKAGGAVILLDPKIPFERLRTICQDVNAQIIVSSCSCADLASQLATTVVTVGPDTIPPGQNSTQITLPSKFTPGSALYAIFTSGSTGKPKGIVIPHSASYTSCLAQQRPLYLDPTARTLQFASHMFDVSIADYLWTFLTGGCLCIPSEESLKNNLPGVVNDLQVNRIDMTPSLARVYRPEDMPTLKTILLGGEPMSPVDVQMWAGKVRLVNGYGPSECSVCCILADVFADSDPSNIGHTYGAVSWIVDKDNHNRLAPPGAPGELLLEGPILARGYLGEPEKNAAAFIESSPPWLQDLRSGSRLYKTGDLVRYSVDGTIQYIGRKDTQVKIRGQRVELGEIEHHIRQASSSGARNVVVDLVNPSAHGQTGPILVAFFCDNLTTVIRGETDVPLFVPNGPQWQEEAQATVQALVKRLPSYMIPSAFIPLAYMPVSPSGKADRRFIHEHAAAFSRQELEPYLTRHATQRAPRTKSEEILRSVVSEVLGLDAVNVGMDDDFFELGGDSIIAIRLVSRARQSGFSFRVTDVFRSPKLSALALLQADGAMAEATLDTALLSAHYLGFAGREDMIDTILSSQPYSFSKDDVCEILPVTEATHRMLLQAPEYWAINLEGTVDYNQLQRACTELVQRHEILRAVFVQYQDESVQVILNHIDTAIQHQGSVATLDGFVDQHRREDHITTPTIGTPVTRFTFVQGPQQKQILVVRLSHAQFDGYCLQTLWHDLKCLYEGVSLTPAAKPASHIQQWMMAQQQEEAFSFWKDVLDGSTVTRIDNATFGDTSNEDHSPHLITAQRRVCPGTAIPHSITQATLLKAAWAFLLARVTGEDSVVFAQNSNGRNYASPDAHRVVGMCLNTVPVRVSLNPAWTALDLMQSVQQQHRDSLPYELVDFHRIIDHATPWPKGTRHQSNLLHQNLDPDTPFAFGDAQALVTCSYEWPEPPDEILVESLPLPDGGLRISLDTSTAVLSQANADSVVEKLCRLVTAFSNSPYEPLSRLGGIV
ncbi:hypothetical protein BJX61DRAFT_546918 [Aspergillus egyptiacus]|nr:hypothetical protein BJX61DRAFT_546918 [Aspergillus egyptiacus]